jgi:hypothetical protein
VVEIYLNVLIRRRLVFSSLYDVIERPIKVRMICALSIVCYIVHPVLRSRKEPHLLVGAGAVTRFG